MTAMVPLNWIPAPSSEPYRDKIQTACRLPWFLPTPRFGRRSVYTLTQSIVTTDSQTIAAKLNGEYIRAKNNNQRLSILGSRSAYRLYVVYIPVVEKQILWSKRCKDESLRGTVKETITQVSRSKKWDSKPVLDEDGNPMLNAKGKKILKSSYSVLQDDFFNFMRNVGYTDVERGERGSTEEHLTVTQFKVAQEKQRLETMTAQIAQTEQTLNNTQAVIEKKEKELQSLQKQAKEQHAAALTVQEIRSMGKKTITGNVSFTPSECNILKDYAVTGLLVKAENSRLEEKLRSAQCSAAIWKQRYDALYNAYQELKKEVQPYLDAVKLAPEKVRAFFDELLTRTRQARQPTKPIRRKQDMER